MRATLSLREGAGLPPPVGLPGNATIRATRAADTSVVSGRHRSAPAPALEVSDARRARLWVIDDEPRIGAALARVFARQHDVTVEHDARDALARVAAGEVFDLVFCDLMMPYFTGMDFFVALRATNPELTPRVVFLTGGAFTEQARSFVRCVPNPTVGKPFSIAEIRAAAHGVLGLRPRPISDVAPRP